MVDIPVVKVQPGRYNQFVRRLACYAFAFLAIALSGCAITAGSTFSDVIATVDSEEQSDTADTTSVSAEEFALRVLTEPSDATVLLNGRNVGTTPITLDDLETGSYTLEIAKNGYYTERRRIDIRPGQALVVDTTLELIVGYLDLTVTPSDATLRLDGALVGAGVREVAVGERRITATRFGYRDESIRVRVEPRRTTRVALNLEQAPFLAENLSAFRSAFNPRNPGATGTSVISYRVTAPGSGRLVIRDAAESTVRDVPLGPFHTWDQRYIWDGRDGSGAIVEDGVYSAEASFRGNDGTDVTLVTPVTVDSSISISYSSIWGAAAGLMYAPLLSPLSQGWTQIALQGTGIISVVDEHLVSRFPVRLGTRIGFGAGAELMLYGGLIAHSDPLSDRVQLGGSLLWSPAIPGSLGSWFSAGAAVGGMYQSASDEGLTAGPDTQAGAPGFFAQLPIAMTTGPVTFVLSPEFRYSYAPVVYGDETLPSDTFGSLGYLRSGVNATLGPLQLGLSTAIRTNRFADGLAVSLPVPVALEAHWILPGSPVAVSGYVAGEFDSFSDFYVMSGAGIGVLF